MGKEKDDGSGFSETENRYIAPKHASARVLGKLLLIIGDFLPWSVMAGHPTRPQGRDLGDSHTRLMTYNPPPIISDEDPAPRDELAKNRASSRNILIGQTENTSYIPGAPTPSADHAIFASPSRSISHLRPPGRIACSCCKPVYTTLRQAFGHQWNTNHSPIASSSYPSSSKKSPLSAPSICPSALTSGSTTPLSSIPLSL